MSLLKNKTIEGDQGLSVVSGICKKNRATNRAKILEWEEIAKEMPQIEIPVKHTIHGEMYAREITIPKGTTLTGDIYKFDHFDIMVSGDITVSTDSEETVRMTGFNFLSGLSGKKRAGYAHEDTRWITIHPFTGQSGEEIQNIITAGTFEELKDFNNEINRLDYLDLVGETGLSQSDIDEQVLFEGDLLDDDHIENNRSLLEIKDSGINGLGVFACADFKTGEALCCSRLGNERTKYGRYTNHALFPNAELLILDEKLIFVATKAIFSGEEITVNYRDLLNKRINTGDLCQALSQQ